MENRHFRTSELFGNGTNNLVSVLRHNNYSIYPHSHEFTEINIVTEGFGIHTIEDTDINVKTGDVFVIPPGIVHSYDGKKNGLCVLHLLLHGDFIKRYSAELYGITGYQLLFSIEPLLRKNLRNTRFLHADISLMNYIKSEIAEIMSSGNENHIYRNVTALNLVCRLCNEMYKSFSVKHKTTDKSSELQIMKVLKHISANLSDKLQTEDLAAIANMSASTLNRHFKQLLGITPGNYIIGKRIEAAKSLIAENRYSKTEIAHMCGFHDSSHMKKYM